MTDAERSCPEFEPEVQSVGGSVRTWAESVLAWANADVFWSHEPERKVLRPSGRTVTVKPWQSWGLAWKHGVIGDLTPRQEDEPAARVMAAMIVYLWLKGVPIWLAKDLAYSFARSPGGQS